MYNDVDIALFADDTAPEGALVYYITCVLDKLRT